jgi:SAM-dependent methyltransferase
MALSGSIALSHRDKERIYLMSSTITTEPTPVLDACPLCGWRGIWKDADVARRDAQSCGRCRASLRYRNQAASILTHLGRGRYVTLRDLVRDADIVANAAVYEVALHGPFIKYFSEIKKYVRSYFWANAKLGETYDGVRCEDLTKLTFAENSFDLVVSSDVMEHVFNYEDAFREIFRVLRPGGVHVLSIPITWPIPASTVNRAEERDGEIVHNLEPRFHRAGDGTPALVCTDFGFDLLNLLDGIGYEAWFERPSLMRHPGYFDALVVCRKPREPAFQQASTTKSARKMASRSKLKT